jgi:hypothetical protein
MKIHLSEEETSVLARYNLLFDAPPSPVLDPDQVDELRDKLGDLLQDIGFDKDYRLTPEGKTIEALIDKLLVRK